MIEFISTTDFELDTASHAIAQRLREVFKNEDGFSYYKDTLITTNTGVVPEIIIYLRSYQPIIVRCFSWTIDEIESIRDDYWVAKNEEVDSPLYELDDFEIKLKAKLDGDRLLRQKLSPIAILALPLITHADFQRKFGNIFQNTPIAWMENDSVPPIIMKKLPATLSDIEWRTLRSIAQGIRSLRQNATGRSVSKKQTLGEAIKELEKQIALLDIEQEKAAKQIAPGIQRIRGLAGTGKTVLLALRAAEIHRLYPDKKILFTFNTQALYNQTRKLVAKFYEYRSDGQPFDEELLHIRHAWGGRNRPGVYYDLCARQGIPSLSLNDVKSIKSEERFRYVCKSALARTILPEYDFILVDEAQDFPNEFFQILRSLSYPPHRICYAYDELQSLFSLDIPKPEDMFGVDKDGIPFVVFDGEDYPGGVEKEFVLHRSYRCPQPVLMLAHAIGLGIYSPYGCVQMLEKEESWQSIGYEIRSGKLSTGESVEIYRPPQNSPSQISDVYGGDQDIIATHVFDSRPEEIDWITTSIEHDIREEKVAPEQIIVISLDTRLAKDYMAALQQNLLSKGISSTIPGVIDDTSAFMESGKVTLSTIFRAKGNEAPIVYIMSFEALYDYLDSIENRNRAFTSISRAKAWVRITGVGKKMQLGYEEISKIRQDYPCFRFQFPDMEAIRRLDAITIKRRKEVEKARTYTSNLLNFPPEILAVIAKADPDQINALIERLNKAKDEHQ